VQRQQLLTESKILRHEILMRAERTENPSEEVSEPCEHGSILSQQVRSCRLASC
jgi:hypothetical protein